MPEGGASPAGGTPAWSVLSLLEKSGAPGAPFLRGTLTIGPRQHSAAQEAGPWREPGAVALQVSCRLAPDARQTPSSSQGEGRRLVNPDVLGSLLCSPRLLECSGVPGPFRSALDTGQCLVNREFSSSGEIR